MAVTIGGLSVGTLLRMAVLVIAGVATVALCLLLGMMRGMFTSGESLSRSIAWAVATIYGFPYLVCVVPALILAILDRWLPLALVLCVLAVPLTLFLLRSA